MSNMNKRELERLMDGTLDEEIEIEFYAAAEVGHLSSKHLDKFKMADGHELRHKQKVARRPHGREFIEASEFSRMAQAAGDQLRRPEPSQRRQKM